MDRAVVEYLANAFWQIPLLVAGVAGLLWALGADVRTRHRVWLAVLAIAVLLPLRGMEPKHQAQAAPAVIVSREVLPAETIAVPPLPAVERHKPMLVFGEVSGRWLVRFYLAALAFFAWRILRSWIAAQGLLRRSRSIDLAPRAMAIFAQVADGQGVPGGVPLPRLRQSDETISPVVIGAVRPVLPLPAGFDRLKDDEVRAALSHEFAHLARRDYLVNLISQIFSLPLAWHPAMHYVHKQIRDTREMLCDAVAAEEMASPVRYATCLVAFALRALDGHDAALATQGVSMFDNRVLEERILQLTQAPERPDPSTRLARLAGASAGLAMALTMALLIHITPTWAETPVAAAAEPPVQLTPPVELPAIPVTPAAPAAPAAVATPPAAPAPPAQPRHVHQHLDADTRRALAEEDRQRARDQAQRQRDEGQRQRDLAQQQRDETQRQREEGQRQRELAQQQREQALEQAQAQRERALEQAQAERERAQERREAAREALQASREAMQDVDMNRVKQEIARATAAVQSPEFKAQMVDLQAHMQQLHDNMAELREHMKTLSREIEKSPM